MKRTAALLCILLLFVPAVRAEEAIIIPEEYRNPLSDFSLPDEPEAAEPAPTPFSALFEGSTGEAVAMVRQRLFALGFLADGMGDTYDQATAAAVLAFQQKTGLAQTGRVNTTTWNTLMDENAASIGGAVATMPPSAPQATPAPTDPATQNGWIVPATATPGPDGANPVYEGVQLTRLLKHGMEGDDVKAVQMRLAELGYFKEKFTGGYYAKTEQAVEAFQRKNSLSSDGIVGQSTWNAMMGAAVQKDGSTAQPVGSAAAETPPPAADVALRPASVATTPQPTAEARPFTYERKLEYGSTGDDVSQVQQRLLELGYYDAKITGGYYKQTRAAVRAFQKNNGLKVDGVAGRDTQEALFLEPQPVTADATPRPTATPAPMPYMLEVDVVNQITTAYGLDERGEYTVLVRRMICSTGTKSDPTPIQTVKMPSKRARWGYFPEWDSHAQYLTRIDSLNAFHSVLYTEPDVRKLAVSSYKKLGERASHGCVRLLVADAKWIYDNCQAGTVIRIFEGVPDPELTQSLKPPALDYDTMLPSVTPQPTAEPYYDGVTFPEYTGLLKRGVQSEAVYILQRRLTDLGYYTGTVTGGYYEGTIAAVKAFQKDHGLSVDGVAGKDTLAALYSPSLNPAPAMTPAPELPLTAEPTPGPEPTLGPTAPSTAMPAPVYTPAPTLIPVDADFSGNAVG